MKHRRGIDLVAPIAPARFHEYQPSSSVYETVGGLREWEVLGAKCGKCGHTAWLDKAAVVRRYGNRYLRNLSANWSAVAGTRKGIACWWGNWAGIDVG